MKRKKQPGPEKFPVYLAVVLVVCTAAALVLPVAAGSFLDTFDLNFYQQNIDTVLRGNWASVDYPPLAWAPVVIALCFGPLYPWAFIGLMTACNLGSLWVVWKLGGKRAGLLYATAVPIFYLSTLKLDAWPVFLMMAGIWLIYAGKKINGWVALVVGAMSKLFPAVPLLISLGQEDRRYLVGAAAMGIGIVVFFHEYFATTFLRQVYANTLASIVGWVPAVIMVVGAVGVILLYSQRRDLVALSLVILWGIIMASPFRSPQWWAWITPLVVLLVKTAWQTALYYGAMILTFLEFPFLFSVAYTNSNYIMPWAPAFFIALFITWGALVGSVMMNENCKGDIVE